MIRQPRTSKSRAGIEHDHVGERTFFRSREDRLQQGGVHLRITASQIVRRHPAQAEVFRSHLFVFQILIGTGFANPRWPHETDFVDDPAIAGRPVHRPRAVASQPLEDFRERRAEFPGENTDQLAFRTRRVHQRPDDVENRPHSLFRERLPDRSDSLERRMVGRREKESHTRLLDALAEFLRPQIDLHPQRLKHVCPAAFRGDAAVSVLQDHAARRCDDEHGRRGKVEQIHLRAARPADIDRRTFELQIRDPRVHRVLQERLHESRDLRRRLPLFRQRLQQPRLLFIRHPGVQKQIRRHLHLPRRKLLPVFQMMNQSVHDADPSTGLWSTEPIPARKAIFPAETGTKHPAILLAPPAAGR